MGVYDRMAATAARLLASKGRAVDYLRVTTAQDLTNADVTTTVATTQVDCADFDITGQRYKMGDGGNVIAGDRVAYVPGRSLTTEPKPGDKMVIDGKTWAVVAILERIAPAGATVLYALQVRA